MANVCHTTVPTAMPQSESPFVALEGPKGSKVIFSGGGSEEAGGGGSSPTPKPPRQLRGPEEQGAGQKAPVLNEGPQELGSPPSIGHGAVAA